MPLRVFIVTGTPYGSAALTAAVEDVAEQPPLPRQRPSPPLRVTLGTGQPKFRSMWATPYSAQRISAALPT